MNENCPTPRPQKGSIDRTPQNQPRTSRVSIEERAGGPQKGGFHGVRRGGRHLHRVRVGLTRVGLTRTEYWDPAGENRSI